MAPCVPLGPVNQLRWFEAGPRLYTEAMEHWPSTCPRLSMWEDALLAALPTKAPRPG